MAVAEPGFKTLVLVKIFIYDAIKSKKKFGIYEHKLTKLGSYI